MIGTNEAAISCCGKKLYVLVPQKAVGTEKLTVEKIEHDFFISTEHEMSKGHYITFVALATEDSIMLRKQYPEWDIQIHIPCF